MGTTSLSAARAAGESTDMINVGTFSLNGQLFGTDILLMREIIRPVALTRLPQAEQFMEGVINLRGAVIPIVSLRARFGMPRRPFDKDTRIINMDINGSLIGFIIDSIEHVQRFPVSAIEPAPALVSSVDAEYIEGVARLDDQLLIILNAARLVSPERLHSLAQEHHVGG